MWPALCIFRQLWKRYSFLLGHRQISSLGTFDSSLWNILGSVLRSGVRSGVSEAPFGRCYLSLLMIRSNRRRAHLHTHTRESDDSCKWPKDRSRTHGKTRSHLFRQTEMCNALRVVSSRPGSQVKHALRLNSEWDGKTYLDSFLTEKSSESNARWCSSILTHKLSWISIPFNKGSSTLYSMTSSIHLINILVISSGRSLGENFFLPRS